MKLGYNPEMMSEDNLTDAEGFVLKPGTFRFKVDTIKDKVSSGGYNGCQIVLVVDNGAPWEQLSYNWFSYEHKPGLARLKAFLGHLGFSINPPPEDWEVKGSIGEANFIVEEYEKDGEKRQSLKIKSYPKKEPALSSQEYEATPGQDIDEDDVPF